jgi:hypothetical protein
MKDFKEEFNKDIEIFKKGQIKVLEMESSITQIKNSVESIANGIQ